MNQVSLLCSELNVLRCNHLTWMQLFKSDSQSWFFSSWSHGMPWGWLFWSWPCDQTSSAVWTCLCCRLSVNITPQLCHFLSQVTLGNVRFQTGLSNIYLVICLVPFRSLNESFCTCATYSPATLPPLVYWFLPCIGILEDLFVLSQLAVKEPRLITETGLWVKAGQEDEREIYPILVINLNSLIQ